MMVLDLMYVIVLGVIAGVGVCAASEAVPRLSPSFPKDAPVLRESLRLFSRDSRWMRWHVMTLVIGGAAGAALFALYGATVHMLLTGMFVAFFGLVALIDVKYRLIPNALTYPAILVVIVVQVFINQMEIRSLVLGLGFTFAIFAMTAWVSPGNLGGGDIKLALLMGAVFGFPNVLIALLIGVGSGAVAAILMLRGKRKADKMAYAPYLCLGALAILFLLP